MQDPEHIKRFTRGSAMMKDPPWLPMALWFALMPALVQLRIVPQAWWFYSLALAGLATALSARWFKRTYGVVTPSPDSFPGRVKAGWGVVLVLVVCGLEFVSTVVRAPVRLGLVAFGAWLAWGARASNGVRPHLYVLGTICVGVAVVPLVGGHRLQDPQTLGSIIMSAFGLGWAYVCIQDYRVLVRHLSTMDTAGRHRPDGV